MATMSKLQRLLHPHKAHEYDGRSASASQTSLATPGNLTPTESLSPADEKILKDAYGGTCSSMEMFTMFKTMASSRLPGFRRKSGLVGETEEDVDEMELPGVMGTSGVTDSPSAIDTPDVMTPSDTEGAGGEHSRDGSPSSVYDQSIDKEMLASRLAALSMSNISPLTNEAKPTCMRRRPVLPCYHSKAGLETGPPPVDDRTAISPLVEVREPLSPTASETPSNDQSELDASDEEKLRAIIEDFGEIASLQEPTADNDGPWENERLLAESKGSLFRGVLLIGNLHLTTHRLLFHALLPPLAASIARGHPGDGQSQNERVVNSAMAQFTVLHSGPVNIYKPSKLQAKRRVWMELSSEMITSYPSADEAGRVRPIRALMLSSIRSIAPLDPAHPHEFVMTYDTVEGQPPKTTKYTVDTPESALQWRREIEGALFRHARARWARRRRASLQPDDPNALRGDLSERAPGDSDDSEEWSMLRVCIPLDRIHLLACEDYHGFARLLNIDVDLDAGQSTETIPYNSLTKPTPPTARHAAPIPPMVSRSATRRSLDEASRPANDPASTPVKPPLSLKKTISTIGGTICRDSGKNSRPTTPTTPTPSTPTTPAMECSPGPSPLAYIPTEFDPPGRNSNSIDSVNYTEARIKDYVEESETSCNMRIGLLNEQEWFAKAFHAALAATKGRQYKKGAVRPKFVVMVGNHDCLAADDEIEEPSRGSSLDSAMSQVDLEDVNPGFSHAKAEKAAMAAKVFGIDPDEPIWLKRCYVAQGLVPIRGHIIISTKFICFWRRNKTAADVKYRFPAHEVKGAIKNRAARLGMHGMSLQIEGHHDLRFEFWNALSREETIDRINAAVKQGKAASPPRGEQSDIDTSVVGTPSASRQSSPKAAKSYTALRENSILVPRPEDMDATIAVPDEAINYLPFIANRVGEVNLVRPRHFICLTIGSRGDVQPYIALGIGLMKDGHRVTIVTHPEFKDWIESYGITHRAAGGDPTALMKFSSDHKMFSVGFFQESIGYFRGWLDDLLIDSWHACEDADVLIESPSAMAGIHIAEALKIPYFRAFTMPWTRTSAYPQAFLVPAVEMGTGFNYSTYVLYDNIIWTATAPQINRWRKKHLMLKSTDMAHLSVQKIPFLYNFSPAVVPKPLDWHDDITITGYWNLENSDTEWTAPVELEAFIKKARELSKPIIYIGFGSIVVNHADQVTKSIIKAVGKADVYAVIAKGWSSRGALPAKDGHEIVFPENCYHIDKVPHGWLFPQIDAAMHHGGAGTVGASLRAGLPTMIKPFFGDQFFWANRVTRLEAGIRVASLSSDDMASAITKATSSTVMIEKARRIGEKIRAEDGVANAKRAIYSQLTRAASDRTKMHWAKV